MFSFFVSLAVTAIMSVTTLGQTASVEVSRSAEDLQRYIVTGQLVPTEPLYKGNTPGAVHEMRASNGYYYSFDSGEDEAWEIHKSSDMIYWQKLASSAKPIGTWGKSRFWVPEVMEYNGKFYMYYCARSIPNIVSNQIGLAIADKPEGPYYDIGHPLFDGSEVQGMYGIDPNPFIDPDTGEKYLFFVSLGTHKVKNMAFDSSRIFGVRLADDMKSIVGKPKEMVTPSQDWEYKSVTEDSKGSLWLEAPEIIKNNGTYYIMYSANLYLTANYALGVATAKNPLGPYTKYEGNPVVGSVGRIEKAGHNSILRSPDGSEFFTAYTTLRNGRFSSRVGFREDGSMYVNGPIPGYQFMPNGSTEYVNHALQAKVTVSSTQDGYNTKSIVDGEIGIYERFEKYEWVSNSEKAGAWIRLAWDEPRSVEYVMLHDSAVVKRMLNKGHVILNDDPKQTIQDISFPEGPGEAAILRFPEKKEITSITFVADQLVDPDGVIGMSEITVLGPPQGHVWLSSPIDSSTVSGVVPIEIRGLHTQVNKVNVSLTRFSDEVHPAALQLYSGNKLPDQLALDTMQVEDGAYDLTYSVQTADGRDNVLEHRIVVSNWDTLEDPVLPTTANGWFGELKKMLTVAETSGWEFVGSDNDPLFGDTDRIRRKMSSDESLTWKLSRMHSYIFTIYARGTNLSGAVRVEISPDGETWLPASYISKVQDTSTTGWNKIDVQGTISDSSDTNYIRITFMGNNGQLEDLQLGHISITGLSEKQVR